MTVINKVESKTCPLCSSKCLGRPYMDLAEIWKCNSCGLFYFYPQPDLDYLRDHYGKEYFISRSSVEVGYDNYLQDEENICRTFRKRFYYIERFLKSPGTLLDIGCAAGFFLGIAKEKRWKAEGIEISDFMAQHARSRGFSVFHGALEEYSVRPRTFDLVSMWDVIEHLRDPRKDLLKANQLLKPGGYFIFTTPAIDSWPHYLFKSRWMGFKDKEHLFFFTKKNIARILEETGFRICFDKFEGKYVSLDLLKRRIACYSKGLSDLLRKGLRPKWGRAFNFYINPFDIRLVIAQKI